MKIVKRKPSNLDSGNYTPMRSIFDDFFTLPSVFDDMLDRNYMSKNLFADMWEEDENYFIKMAIPGASKDSIDITTSDEYITVKAHTKKTEENKDKERTYFCRTMESSYEQTFNLPTKADSEKAEASYEDGVLTIKLPKSEDVKPKKIEIK